jgi:uncharacterized protein YxjI
MFRRPAGARGAQAPTYTRPVLPTRYRLRGHLWTIGDHFWIEAGDGHRHYYVDERALHRLGAFLLRDASGRERYAIPEFVMVEAEQARFLGGTGFVPPQPPRDAMSIKQDGQAIATVVKGELSPSAGRMAVEFVGGDTLEVHGNLLGYDYLIARGNRRMATVSKEGLIPADTYEVTVEFGEDDALLLTIAAAVDQMARA